MNHNDNAYISVDAAQQSRVKSFSVMTAQFHLPDVQGNSDFGGEKGYMEQW